MKTKMQKTLLFITPLFMLLPEMSSADISSPFFSMPTITCGIANKHKDRLIISNQTKKIPFITKQKNPNFYFGCKVHHPNNIFALHAEITSPQKNNVTSNVGYTEHGTKQTVTLTTKPIRFKNNGYVALKLSEGDLPGKYEIKLFIDNEHIGDISFDVSKSYITSSNPKAP